MDIGGFKNFIVNPKRKLMPRPFPLYKDLRSFVVCVQTILFTNLFKIYWLMRFQSKPTHLINYEREVLQASIVRKKS